MLIGLLGPAVASDRLPIHEADQHIGETKCGTGKALRVKVGTKGVHFLDFCEDQMACPFTVVVFSHHLKDVGDVRRLAGRIIEIKGPVKLYDGGEPRSLQSRMPAADEEAGKNQAPPNTTATYGNDSRSSSEGTRRSSPLAAFLKFHRRLPR